jgi:RHS repeat-associated protein
VLFRKPEEVSHDKRRAGERVITDSLDNNYKFTSHERDGETGLDHTWYRKLSSTLGRWTSADPVKGSCTDPQTLNRYTYVGNDPMNRIDPTGQILEPASLEFSDLPLPSRARGCTSFPNGSFVDPFLPPSALFCPPQPRPLPPPRRLAASIIRGAAAIALRCEGTTDCSYYFRKCLSAKTQTSKAYYCVGAPIVCISAPRDTYSNCVRLCLQVNDRCFNISDFLFPGCQVGLHAMCAAKCGLCQLF